MRSGDARRRAGTRRDARPGSDPAGFTLIEIGVAVTLFSIVLLAAGGLLTALATGSRYSRVRTTGTFYMQRQIERLHELDYDNLATGQADTTLENGTTLRVQWTVSELVPDRLARIDVTVRGLSAMPGGHERAVRLFVSNRDP